MFSALAGFLEPGESIEEACARELNEEAGLRAAEVRYHSTQPWPYPSSLMIGLIAEVEDDEAAPDQTELDEVRWFTRAEARDLIAGRIRRRPERVGAGDAQDLELLGEEAQLLEGQRQAAVLRAARPTSA